MEHELLVLGLGNALHGDDGFGPRLIAELNQNYQFSEEVKLVDGGILGLSLLPLMDEAKVVVVIDTVVFHKEPGTLYKFPLSAIESRGEAPLDLHSIGITEVLQILRGEGKPIRGTVIGIEPGEIRPWTTEFSPSGRECFRCHPYGDPGNRGIRVQDTEQNPFQLKGDLLMHEVSLISNVIATVAQTAEEKQLNRIHKVKLVVGEYTSVMPESLQFAFDLLKRDPFVETAVLEIETSSGTDFYIDYFEGESSL